MTYFAKIVASAIIRRIIIWLAIFAAHHGWISALTGAQIDSSVAWVVSLGIVGWSIGEKVKAHGLDWKQLAGAVLRGGLDGGGAYLMSHGIADANTLHILAGLAGGLISALQSLYHKASVTDATGALAPPPALAKTPTPAAPAAPAQNFTAGRDIASQTSVNP